jgi:hypothetical protein
MIQTTFSKEENPPPPPPPPPPPLRGLRTKNKIAVDRRRARTHDILFKIVTDGRRARTIFLTLSGIQCTEEELINNTTHILFLGILPCTNPHCKSKLLQLSGTAISIPRAHKMNGENMCTKIEQNKRFLQNRKLNPHTNSSIKQASNKVKILHCDL